MANSVEVRIEGVDQFETMVARFRSRFTVAALTARAVALAAEAGQMLHEEVIGQLMKAIYDSPAPEVLFSGSGAMDHGGFDISERSGDLHDAHSLKDEGLRQSVEVDMEYPVSSNEHSGRMVVGDYALSVHDGYIQFIPTKDGGSLDTGTWHPGRPWMELAAIEGFDRIAEFVMLAFAQSIEATWMEVFA